MKTFNVPLPILNGQLPVLLIFDPNDPAIELAYERAPFVGGNQMRSVSRDTTHYWIPRCTPVFAVGDGRIIYSNKEGEGYSILIDHGNETISSYSRLAHAFVRPTAETKVAAGELLGYIGTPRGAALSPLRFELWRWNGRDAYDPVDPLLMIRRWKYREWQDMQLASKANDA